MAKQNFLDKVSFLLYPESMVILGLILITVALYQSYYFGYTAIVDSYLKLFEEPMDKATFGILLAATGSVAYLFWKEQRFGKKKLGLFTLSFAFAIRTFWEISWTTGAYLPSVYTYWSLTHNISPEYCANALCSSATQAWPTLDLIGRTAFYMNFILPVFAFSSAVCIFLILSLIFEHKKK